MSKTTYTIEVRNNNDVTEECFETSSMIKANEIFDLAINNICKVGYKTIHRLTKRRYFDFHKSALIVMEDMTTRKVIYTNNK